MISHALAQKINPIDKQVLGDHRVEENGDQAQAPMQKITKKKKSKENKKTAEQGQV